jgi:8-oxo-dGTP pyrophosphatase MutT (NUDIX family)
MRRAIAGRADRARYTGRMAAARLDARLTVAAVIEKDGRFLVVEERDAGRPVLNQPAGHLEADETLMAAVVREVREETGYACRPTHVVGLYLWSRPGGPTVLRVAFACDLQGDSSGPADPGILATHWLSRAELAGLPLRSPLVARTADDYLAGRRYPLDLLQYVEGGP